MLKKKKKKKISTGTQAIKNVTGLIRSSIVILYDKGKF